MSTWLGMGQFNSINLRTSPLHCRDSPYRHPLEVSSNSIHLALVNADAWPIVAERLLGVVQAAETVPVPVIGYFYPFISTFHPQRSAKTPP